jgi:hypothetical protein
MRMSLAFLSSVLTGISAMLHALLAIQHEFILQTTVTDSVRFACKSGFLVLSGVDAAVTSIAEWHTCKEQNSVLMSPNAA